MASLRALVEVAPLGSYVSPSVVQDDVIFRGESSTQTLYFGAQSNLPLRVQGSNVRVVGTLVADAYSNLPTYNDAAVVASSAYGSNTSTWSSNALVASSNYFGSFHDSWIYSSNTSGSASNLANNNAAYLTSTVAPALTSLGAQATFGSNVSVYASNAVVGLSNFLAPTVAANTTNIATVTTQATFGSNVSVYASNAVVGLSNFLAPTVAANTANIATVTTQATWASNAASYASNLTPQLVATSNAAFYASNAAGAGGATAGGFTVNSNNTTWTSCNVGVNVSQPAYEMTIGGTTAAQRLVITRTVNGLSSNVNDSWALNKLVATSNVAFAAPTPSFMSYSSTSNYQLTNNVYSPVIWSTRVHDSSSNWSAAGTSNITAPAAGWYQVLSAADGLQNYANLYLMYGGAGTVTPSNVQILVCSGASTSPDTDMKPQLVYMTAGAVATVKAMGNGGGNTPAVINPSIIMTRVG